MPKFLWMSLTVVIALCCQTVQSDEAADDNCSVLFEPDTPALFEFVDTRKQIDYQRYAGYEIAGISTVTLPIFNEADPKENNWLYRAANTLHIDTRATTVKRQLIFSTGEALDPKIIRETERELRSKDYLVDAMILPRKVCKNRIYLLVVVRDVWTLTPSASASRSGGENKSGFGVTEQNLLGSGQTLSLGYFRDSDRNGKIFRFRHPNIIGDHTRLHLRYEDNSDGDARGFNLVRPFPELDSTWSAGFSFNDRTETKTIEVNDEVVNEYSRHDEDWDLYAGFSAGRRNDAVQRWELGITWDKSEFETVDADVSEPPESRKLKYPWLQWIFIEDRFATLSNITHSHRNEDIAVGFFHQIRLGRSRQQWDSTQNAWIFFLNSEYSASLGDHHLLRLGGSTDGRYNLDAERPENTLFEGKVDYFHFPDRKNRWYARLRYARGRNLDDDEALSSGGSDNLRGYPNDTQLGNEQWTFSLERRHFTDVHLINLLYLGGAVYLDAGKTWGEANSESDIDETLANVGIGLRGSPSKFNVDKVLHLDIAWPLVAREEVDNYQIILTGQVDF